MDRQIKVNHLYMHFKGSTYRVLELAKDCETEEDLVVYINEKDYPDYLHDKKNEPCVDKKNPTIWVRSLEMFMSEVDREKYPNIIQKYRFEEILPIKIHPNPEIRQEIIDKIKERGGYCPCSLIRNEDTKCMCKEFKESTEIGWCRCGLYHRGEI